MTRWQWQDRAQRLHFIAAGDELPDRTPDWLLNLWPSRPFQRLVCWRYGHTLDTDQGVTFCIWCQHTEPDQ